MQEPIETTVLLVEDDERLASLVERGLRRAGHGVVVVHGGREALEQADDEAVDLIVLDIEIPPPNGMAVLRALRERGDERPVLMLTGRRDVPDRVAGLRSGADDYLSKPFALDELLARIEVLTRRHPVSSERVVRHSGGVELDPMARTVRRDDVALDLTPREFDLLEFLVRNPNQALATDVIRDRVWPEPEDGTESNVVRVYVSYLRAKVDRPFGRNSLQTVRGHGYRWNPDA